MQKTICHQDIWFSGKVQGVGFRYCTLNIAKGFDINGFVQNLSDGRVFLHIEGSEKETLAFLKTIKEELKNFIHDTEERRYNANPVEKNFRIIN